MCPGFRKLHEPFMLIESSSIHANANESLGKFLISIFKQDMRKTDLEVYFDLVSLVEFEVRLQSLSRQSSSSAKDLGDKLRSGKFQLPNMTGSLGSGVEGEVLVNTVVSTLFGSI